MYVLPDPVGACTTTSFPCCNARTASCCHRSGITNPAPNPGVILGRCLQCGLLAIGIGIWRTNHTGGHRCLVVATRAVLLIGSTSYGNGKSCPERSRMGRRYFRIQPAVYDAGKSCTFDL